MNMYLQFISTSNASKLMSVDHRDWRVLEIDVTRPRRWIVTIPLLDQWLATIVNHWKTIVSNGKTNEKPLVPMVCQTQNHWKTIVSNGKTIEKPLVPMVRQTQNHWKTIVYNGKTIEKPSLPMVCKTKNHWYQWLLSKWACKPWKVSTTKPINPVLG